jgi:multidrug efflux pump subunit AcrA (membrane-fusion protein)
VKSDDDGKPMVWKVDPQTMTVSKVSVEVGSLMGDRIEILKGLQNGDQIAISGVHHLREGMQVRRFQD